MSPEFWSQPNPPDDVLGQIAALDPCNPFYTPFYAEAQRRLGFRPWVLGVRLGESLLFACTAFVKFGRFTRRLEIVSVPPVDHELFWVGLVDLCRKSRISILEINSFCSLRADIARLPGETARRSRCEFILDLSDPGFDHHISSHHRRNIRRAQKAGLRVHRATDQQACEDHARSIGLSMGRRRGRGESVSADVPLHLYLSLTESGAAEIFQAVQGEEVVSSILLLKAGRGAYYQSAGTSPNGMELGASPFLIYEVARILQGEGLSQFNLGGAGEDAPGLERFKAGFGGEQRTLCAAEFFQGSVWKKAITVVVRMLRAV